MTTDTEQDLASYKSSEKYYLILIDLHFNFLLYPPRIRCRDVTVGTPALPGGLHVTIGDNKRTKLQISRSRLGKNARRSLFLLNL